MKRMVVFISFLILIPFFIYGQPPLTEKPTLKVFFSPDCHSCLEVKKAAIPEIEKEFGDSIIIEYIDISDFKNYKLLMDLRKKYQPGLEIVMPVFFLNGDFLSVKSGLNEALRPFIISALHKPGVEAVEPETGLLSRLSSFDLLVLIIAGLVNGINPCVLATMIFFILFLSAQGRIRRRLFIVGFSFICAVLLVYMLLSLGVLGFLSRLQAVIIISRGFKFLAGIVSILLGVKSVNDFKEFRKSGKAEGVIVELQFPAWMKAKVYEFFGLHRRDTPDSGKGNPGTGILQLAAGGAAAGISMSLLQVICIVQANLPLASIDIRGGFNLPAYIQIFIYNLMLAMPLLAILFFAWITSADRRFSSFLKRHFVPVKIIFAVIFYGSGIFLILS